MMTGTLLRYVAGNLYFVRSLPETHAELVGFAAYNLTYGGRGVLFALVCR